MSLWCSEKDPTLAQKLAQEFSKETHHFFAAICVSFFLSDFVLVCARVRARKNFPLDPLIFYPQQVAKRDLQDCLVYLKFSALAMIGVFTFPFTFT